MPRRAERIFITEIGCQQRKSPENRHNFADRQSLRIFPKLHAMSRSSIQLVKNERRKIGRLRETNPVPLLGERRERYSYCKHVYGVRQAMLLRIGSHRSFVRF